MHTCMLLTVIIAVIQYSSGNYVLDVVYIPGGGGVVGLGSGGTIAVHKKVQ